METNGNGKKLQAHINKEHTADIDRLYGHAEIANQEMGSIKKSIAVLENDFNWMKIKMEAMDKRLWWVIATVLFGIGVQILLNFFT